MHSRVPGLLGTPQTANRFACSSQTDCSMEPERSARAGDFRTRTLSANWIGRNAITINAALFSVYPTQIFLERSAGKICSSKGEESLQPFFYLRNSHHFYWAFPAVVSNTLVQSYRIRLETPMR